jgi:osmotically-inducible protein OsmY
MAPNLMESDFCCAGLVEAAEENKFGQGFVERDDLEHRIVRFLHAHGLAGAEGLDVSVSGGTVALRGFLPDRHAKWLCLECCRHVAGVMNLIDNVEIDYVVNESG